MKWLKRLGISLTIAFFAVCCGAVLLFNWSALGWKALSVPTGSMRPTIPPGSLVLMHRVPVTTLKVGDVITYANPLDMRKTITHRVITTYKLDGRIPAFITKGDANPSSDRPVVSGQVLGKAAWYAPRIGAWLSWSKTWLGLAILVYLPALLLMIEEVLRLNAYWKKSKTYMSAQILERLGALSPKKHRLVQATSISFVAIAGSALLAFPAQALLLSNAVALGPNNLRVTAVTPPPQCTSGNNTTTTVTTGGSGSNSVNVNNNNNQNAQTGNAAANGGGTATSGNASNCNSTTTTITIH